MAFHLFSTPSVLVVLKRWAQDARATAKENLTEAEKFDRRAAWATAQAKRARTVAGMYENLAVGYEAEAARMERGS